MVFHLDLGMKSEDIEFQHVILIPIKLPVWIFT
jgi:hypothetical protein